MIPVDPASEPASFKDHVRKRGEVAIKRLLGQPVKARGRKPTTTFAREEDIPADKFPAYWTEARKADSKSALDDLMDLYQQQCAYLAMRIERATGSPTVDHYVPKSKDWRLVYEWSNYRLSAACVNAKKGVLDVVDPFKVKPGWFELNLDTFEVVHGSLAPNGEHQRIDDTRTILNLRDCLLQRGEYIRRYRDGKLDLSHLEYCAPFIAAELRRQGQLLPGDA